jgi:cation diffusion facilitator CzcD-associated flavoprotein CzcO
MTAPTLAGQSTVRDRSGAYAVIGSGPHGLSSLKALRQLGLDADGYERASDLGGNWNYGAPTSRVYESTHLISSKPFTQFPDFPMPDAFPDYPSHRHIKVYFDAYAQHFGLRERITFDAEVVKVEPAAGGGYLVTVRDTVSGTESTTRYSGVVVANGHNWNPKIPEYPGLNTFTGEVLHSAQYKNAEILRGKRVLVVGAGNTGCDVAVESAQNAKQTFHSSRRAYYYNPKFALGRPSDQVSDLLLALKLPLPVRRFIFSTTYKAVVGDTTRFGLAKPDHKFFETHPIVNQQLTYYVGHGDLMPKPDVARFTEDTVYFNDGTSAQVDLVIFCTGYLVTFPFLDNSLVNWVDGRPQLHAQVFVPGRTDIFISGLVQPDSGQWTIAHWQGMAIATFLKAQRDNPPVAAAFAAKAEQDFANRFSGGTHYKDSTRHYYEIAHQDYLAALQDAIDELESA